MGNPEKQKAAPVDGPRALSQKLPGFYGVGTSGMSIFHMTRSALSLINHHHVAPLVGQVAGSGSPALNRYTLTPSMSTIWGGGCGEG